MPFSAAPGKRIAVVGPLADDAQEQLGDWAGNSGQVNWMPDGQPREMITTVLDGFKQLAPEGCEVAYSRGANIIDLVDDPEGEFYPDGQPRPKLGVSAKFDQQLLDEAVDNARRSDLVVAVVGDVVQLVGETCSTATLELLGGQNAMLEALANVARETGKPLVVVLMSSKPQVMPACVIGTNGVIVDESTADGVSAFMWAPNPGMKGGQAIAEIILGEDRAERTGCRSPSRAMPDQLPVYYNQIRGQHGNRYADLTQDPAFAFGEGLGYTTFAYGEPTITNAPRFRHVHHRRHRARRSHPHQHRRAQGHRSSAGLYRRYRDVVQLERTASSKRSSAWSLSRVRPRPLRSIFRFRSALSSIRMPTASSSRASSRC